MREALFTYSRTTRGDLSATPKTVSSSVRSISVGNHRGRSATFLSEVVIATAQSPNYQEISSSEQNITLRHIAEGLK